MSVPRHHVMEGRGHPTARQYSTMLPPREATGVLGFQGTTAASRGLGSGMHYRLVSAAAANTWLALTQVDPNMLHC